jgi:hypothetical protein
MKEEQRQWTKWGSEKSSNLPKATSMEVVKQEFHVWPAWLQISFLSLPTGSLSLPLRTPGCHDSTASQS